MPEAAHVILIQVCQHELLQRMLCFWIQPLFIIIIIGFMSHDVGPVNLGSRSRCRFHTGCRRSRGRRRSLTRAGLGFHLGYRSRGRRRRRAG